MPHRKVGLFLLVTFFGDYVLTFLDLFCERSEAKRRGNAATARSGAVAPTGGFLFNLPIHFIDIRGMLSAANGGTVMRGYKNNIEKLALANNNFREVLYTAKHSQLVLMSLQPNEDIGAEIHKESDQFFRFEKGDGKVIIDDKEYLVSDGDAIIVPSGAKHNIINTSGDKQLKMYTLYSPPHHKDGTIHQTKEQAATDTEKFDGQTTE